ncbi:cytochrome b [Oceanicella actignis]|uniref:cytochrome b n=1 Tax=Oceanicella actignis TaxID=1189325 RepID=UPI0011E61244|nr:cytochrome b/b6 domain-containing protein [Oceanicella actignis]TYO89241.1 cytochrome b561 [Oceanicella actignis]
MTRAPKGYSPAQIALHWIGAAALVAAFVSHDSMLAALRALREGAYSGPDAGVLTHVIAGLAVLALALWRLSLRARRGAPPPPADEPSLARALARATHVALHALMIALPVTGAAAWFGGLRLAGEIHGEALKPILLIAVALHVAGALHHGLWLRSGVAARMFRPDRAR